ncbi:MAG TPA: hypothetical protein VGV91_18060 [Rubrobacter sp.]|nr:hypothetical protein [Rubrobacter sp.]
MSSRPAKPVILAACDDPGDMRRIERELRTRYEADYRVVLEVSAGAGLEALRVLGEAGDEVALVLADQQMRGTSGVDEETETVSAAALFVLIGAEPRRGWLPGGIGCDEKGFIATGQDSTRKWGTPGGWPLERPPLLLETSMPGVFAVGDARYRSVKRVASAVGEGSIVIQQVHEYLSMAQRREETSGPPARANPGTLS